MDALTAVGLALAALATGVLNTAAGGGAIVTFLALTASGVPALTAHATGQLVTPVSFASAAPLATVYSPGLPVLLSGCLGTVAGVAVLAITPPGTFQAVAPFVLVPAAIVVAGQDAVRRRLHRAGRAAVPARTTLAGMLACGLYAGLVGVGTGTLALVVLGLASRWAGGSLRELIRTRNVLCLAMAVVVGGAFAATGLVDWGLAALIAGPALLGGWLGTRLAGRLPEPVLQAGIVTTATAGALWMLLGAL